MRIENVQDVLDFLRHYSAGVFVRGEAVLHLVQAASKCSPTDLVAHIPQDLLDGIREETMTLPPSASDVGIISGVLGGPGFNYEEYYTGMQQTWFDGAIAWRRYFGTDAA